MISRSCLDLLNLLSLDEFQSVRRIPRVMTAEGVLSDFETDRCGSGALSGRRIMVANQLPIRATQDEDTGKWAFDWDEDSLLLHLKDGLRSGTEALYVGSLRADVDAADQDEVSHVLWDKFRCVPTFLPPDLQNMFYHGFCKHYLWPLFHYMLPMSRSQGAQFDRAKWQAYVSANRIFADKIMEVINPDDDYVWIQDYHLMVLPTFLRRRFHRIRVGFFLHSPFPSSEIYRTMPVRDEILRALLNCDLVGFHTFDYARHFLSCCSRMLGLDYESKRGYIGLEYCGRTVSIKILPVGIHMGLLQSILSMDSTYERVKRLRERYEGKVVILGVDDLDLFKGISLKFLAMGQLLEQHPELQGKAVLIQITNPARSSGSDVQQVEDETNSAADEINRKYRQPGYEPIVYIKGPVTLEEKAAYFSLAECVIVNAVRDGMNLVPYKYTVCRQGSPVTDKASGVDKDSTPRSSMIIVSEFIGCSPSLSGAIRVNPWDVDCVSEAMNSAITISNTEKQMRHEKHYKYITSHDVSYWARSFDQDLERACKEHYSKRFWGFGFALGFRVVALGPSFRKLTVDHLVSAYRSTNSRLILLDYDGTLVPKASIDKRPNSQVLSILERLSSDPNNVVFIASGRGKDSLGDWFASCEKLGLSAEHGYFTRWSKDSSWETCGLTMDFNWKNIVAPVIEQYTEATDGSFVETKETALVWHHQEADPHFGTFQAKELLDHLESVLTNEPVVVKRGQHIVEVKPQGISKGLVVDSLVSTMKSRGKSPDFVLCIGDDRSDEDMFERIASIVSNPSFMPIANVFACTVGQKPSMAKYYLEDTNQVLKLLEGATAITPLSLLKPDQLIYSGYSCAQGCFSTPRISEPSLRGLKNILRLHIRKENCSEWETIPVPSSVRAIVALNLHNYGSGRNPWVHLKPDDLEKGVLRCLPIDNERGCSLGQRIIFPLSRREASLRPIGMMALLEIFGFKQGWHAPFVMVELISAKHIALAAVIQLEVGGGEWKNAYIQMDGVPWKQPLSHDYSTFVEIKRDESDCIVDLFAPV